LCRRDAAPESKFCSNHASSVDDRVDPGLEAELTSGLEKFDSPAAINDLLARLIRLLAQDRISPRRAAVLAYISNQILRSVHAMEEDVDKNQKIEYIIGAPRPAHDLPKNPYNPEIHGPSPSDHPESS